MNASISQTLESVLHKALGRKALPAVRTDDTPLLGGVPGFDSLAVISILTGIREQFGCEIAEDEVSADLFESVGTLRRFVEERLDAQA